MSKRGTDFPDTRLSLLRQLKSQADDAAWSEFVSIYRPIIYRIARKRRLQDADAQDLAQDILVSISNAIESFDTSEGSVRFRHWLRRVARNAILNALTRKPRDAGVGGTGLVYDLSHPKENDESIDRDLMFEYRREMFARAATEVQKDVEPDTWLVFQLAVIEKVPIGDVAKRLQKSVGAAYACRGRVMNRLRRAIERMEKDEA